MLNFSFLVSSEVLWRGSGLMASASIPETYCVKLGRTLNSLSAFLHSGVYMGTSELNAEANPTMDIPSHPAGGGRGGL